MQFLVFGATGRTGAAFVRQALAAGHVVSALVRSRGTQLPAGLEVAVGDVLDPAAVRAAVSPDRVIVVTLGGAAAMTAGCANVVTAATGAGARRLLGVVGAGVLQADPDHLRCEMPDYPPRFREIAAANRAFYDVLAASPLDWTLACTPRIIEGPRTEGLLTSPDYPPDGTGTVTTEDVAAFLLREALAPSLSRSRVGLNGAPPP
jgi:putative NADH-flavin reductase